MQPTTEKSCSIATFGDISFSVAGFAPLVELFKG